MLGTGGRARSSPRKDTSYELLKALHPSAFVHEYEKLKVLGGAVGAEEEWEEEKHEEEEEEKEEKKERTLGLVLEH